MNNNMSMERNHINDEKKNKGLKIFMYALVSVLVLIAVIALIRVGLNQGDNNVTTSDNDNPKTEEVANRTEQPVSNEDGEEKEVTKEEAIEIAINKVEGATKLSEAELKFVIPNNYFDEKRQQEQGFIINEDRSVKAWEIKVFVPVTDDFSKTVGVFVDPQTGKVLGGNDYK